MPASDDRVRALAALLEGASWLGAELEAQYRVLGLTIEPREDLQVEGVELALPPTDRRIQVLLHPSSTFVASLRVHDENPRVEAFTVDLLPDVVHALDAPVITGPVLGQPEPTAGEWGPEPSVQGRSNALDGRHHRLRIEVEAGVRALGLFATFDDIDVRLADGTAVDLPGSGGDDLGDILSF